MEDFSDYSAPELVKMLGSRFKEYRLRANMTQKEVAEMAGLSVLSVYRFEKNNRNHSIYIIRRIRRYNV